jgi:hypothetical protein
MRCSMTFQVLSPKWVDKLRLNTDGRIQAIPLLSHRAEWY